MPLRAPSVERLVTPLAYAGIKLDGALVCPLRLCSHFWRRPRIGQAKVSPCTARIGLDRPAVLGDGRLPPPSATSILAAPARASALRQRPRPLQYTRALSVPLLAMAPARPRCADAPPRPCLRRIAPSTPRPGGSTCKSGGLATALFCHTICLYCAQVAAV